MTTLKIKCCSKCGEVKLHNDFYSDVRRKDGLQAKCKCCKSVVDRHRYTKMLSEIKKQHANYRAANREVIRSRVALCHAVSPEKSLARNAERRAAKLRATPSWEFEFTAFVSREALRLSAARRLATGFCWHVDHVVPLKGIDVCGLHVAANFAVIPAITNLQKNNRHFP